MEMALSGTETAAITPAIAAVSLMLRLLIARVITAAMTRTKNPKATTDVVQTAVKEKYTQYAMARAIWTAPRTSAVTYRTYGGLRRAGWRLSALR